MLRKTVVATVLLAAVLIGATVVTNAGKRTVMDGNRLTIDSGGHHLEGVLTTIAPYQFLLKDKGISLGTFSGDAFVTMLPFQTAEFLRRKYGDFFRCREPGALQAMQEMQAAILVADTEKTRQAVKEAMALVRQSRIPVVRFSGASLHVLKQTYRGMEVRGGTGIPIYYVTDFVIVSPDYRKHR
jgi:hypothetical protein